MTTQYEIDRHLERNRGKRALMVLMAIMAVIVGLGVWSLADAANQKPVISGTPKTAVTVGDQYSFRPTSSDAERNKLSFVIKNRPSWLSFSYQTGGLSGTPTAANTGLYTGITIYVRDGVNSAVALKPFSIAVLQPAMGSATLSWTPPTKNTNGTALTNLAGYRVYYGTSATAMTSVVQINNPGITTYVVDGLKPALYYFSVRAWTSAGVESVPSNVATKSI